MKGYIEAVRYTFAQRCDYAQLIKIYGKDDIEGERKYAPPAVVETKTEIICGSPDPRRMCTSIVERSNLTIRMTVRRLTRLTNAFSKKWENLHAMMSLYFAFYNFCRIHSSLRCTPAMESGITGQRCATCLRLKHGPLCTHQSHASRRKYDYKKENAQARRKS